MNTYAEENLLVLLEKDPQNTSYLSQLALLYVQEDQWQKGIDYYTRLLDLQADNSSALCNRGTALSQLQRYKEALEDFDRALTLNPHYLVALQNKSAVLLELSRQEEKYKIQALQCFQALNKLKPDNEHTLFTIADILREIEQFAESIFYFDQIVQKFPQNAVAWNNRGIVLKNLGRLGEAIQSYDHAIQADVSYAFAYQNRANVLQILDRFTEAITDYQKAIQLDRDFFSAYTGLAGVFVAIQDFPQAIFYYEKARLLKPNDANLEWNYANLELLLGRFQSGWQSYEYRGEVFARYRPKLQKEKLWDGQASILGKTILIWCEQGLGDTLQFCRYIKKVKDCGAQVILETRADLLAILRNLAGVDRIILHGDALPYFDFHCPLLSLPLRFATFAIQDIPHHIPYLFANQERIAYWQGRLGSKTKPRIGLVWNGGSGQLVNLHRDMNFQQIARLNDPALDFYSLQKGDPAESDLLQLKDQYWQGDNFHILTEDIHYWADTAGFIHHLDLIIGVDTSVIHLAGAMGKPVWLLNRFDTCWRWLLEREDSPWYPTLRIFRQNKIANWDAVIVKVQNTLKAFFSQQGQATTYTVPQKHLEVKNKEVIQNAHTQNNAELFREAILAHQNKQFSQAEVLYQELLKWNDKNLEIWNRLAGLYMETSRYEDALNTIEKAVQLSPNQVQLYFNQALVLEKLGRFEEAIACFEQAVKLAPEHLIAHRLLANLYHRLHKLEQALKCTENVIRLSPIDANLYYNQGILLSELGRLESAVQSYQKAIQLAPNFAEAFANMGSAYSQMEKHEETLNCFNHAIALKPNNSEFHNNRALVLLTLKRLEDAFQDCQQAIAIDQNYPLAYNTRGRIYEAQGDLTQALDDYSQAIKLKANYVNAYNNRALLYQRLLQVDLAQQDFEQAIALDTKHVAQKNIAYILLLKGMCERGWRQAEYRWTTTMESANRYYKQALWLGEEDIQGKTLFIWREQGYGDVFQFCRLLRIIKKMKVRIIFEADDNLKEILQSMNVEGRVVIDEYATYDEPSKHFDYHCPLMSLPLALKIFSESVIPAEVPYLFAPPDKITSWGIRLGNKTKPRIGLVWTSGNLFHFSARRDIAFAIISQLREDRFDFYSLQKGNFAESELLQIKDQYWKSDNFHILTENIHNWADTASLIHHLDLIISVDTSVLHLAGAMGKRVWLLNRFDTCWRFGLERQDSPWYPTLKIFRQSKIGDWDSVIKQVRQALEHLEIA